MDPKQQLSQLDPKLKEAYERVMSTTASPNPTATPAAPTPIPPVGNPTAPSAMPMPNINSTTSPFPTPSVGPSGPTGPTTPQSPTAITPNINGVGTMSPRAAAQPPVMPQTTPTVLSPGTPSPAPTTGPVKVQFSAQIGQPASAPGTSAMGVQKKKGGKTSPILIVIAVVVFLIAYAIFWMKVFNLPIPFLG